MSRKRLARWFRAANVRRAELIDKLPECGGPGVTPEERAEFEALQKRCSDEVDRVHPLPKLPAKWQKLLKRIEREEGR